MNFLRGQNADRQTNTTLKRVHTLDWDALRSPAITFWSVWENDSLVGCGALKELEPRRGEIKSMRTAKIYRRRGITAKMLEHIIGEAQQRAYDHLYLETDPSLSSPPRALSGSFGFEYRGPLGAHIEDVNNVFMTKY